MADNDIARLGFDIDTGPLKELKQQSEAAAAAAVKVAEAAERVEKKTKEAAKAEKEQTVASKDAATASQQQATATQRLEAELLKTKQRLDQVTAAMRQQSAAGRDAARQAVGDNKNLTDALLNFSGAIGTIHPRLGFLAQAVANNYSNMIRMRRATLDLGESLGHADKTGGSFFSTISMGTAKVLIGVGIVALIGVKLWEMAKALAEAQDRWAGYEARLRLATGSQQAAAETLALIYANAQKTGTNLQTTIDAFLRLQRSSETIGLTRDEVVSLTETVQKLGIVSGASAGELGSAMLQFSQALASGRLQGDELRSIMENMPALAKAIATGLGVSIGQIRELGASGQLTARDIALAVIKQRETVEAEFKQMPDTVERAMQRMANSTDKWRASMASALGLSEKIRGFYNFFAGIAEATTPGESQKSLEDQIEEQKRIIQRLEQSEAKGTPRGMQRSLFGQPSARVERERFAQLEGEYYRLMELQRQGREEVTSEVYKPYKADVSTGERVSQTVLEDAQKLKQAERNVRDLEQALFSLETLLISGQISPEDFAKKWDVFSRSLDTARRSAESARNPLEALEQNLAKIAEARGLGLKGGAIDMFVRLKEAQEKAKNATEAGLKVDEAHATLIREKVEELRKEVDQQTQATAASTAQVGALGQGKKAMDDVKIETQLAAIAMRLFGKSLADLKNPEAWKGIEDGYELIKKLRKTMQDDAENQRKLSGAGVIQGLRDQLKAVEAQEKSVALGPFAVRQAEAIANAEKARREHGQAAYDLELKIFTARERLAAITKIANLEQERALARAVLAAGLSPRAINQARARLQAEQESRDLPPDKRAEFIATKLKKDEEDALAAVRQRTAQMKVGLDLMEDEHRLLLASGVEYEVQRARLEVKRQALEQGLDPANAEVRLQMEISAELARQNYELNLRRERLADIKEGFAGAGREIFSGLRQLSEGLLSGTRLSAQQTAEIIRSMAVRATQNIIENVMIKPIERAATTLLEKLAAWLGQSLGGLNLGGLGGSGGLGGAGLGGLVGGGLALGAHGFITTDGHQQHFARGAAFGRHVDRPEQFQFFGRGGVPMRGLRGEAGDEGLFPLTKTASGDLAINAAGAGISVVVNDMRSAAGSKPVEVEEGAGPDGKRIIKVTVRDEVRRGIKSGDYDSEFRANYSVARSVTRR